MTTKRYFGCLLRQRIDDQAIPFFVFQVRVKDLKQWAGVKRVEDLPDGTQRVLRETRARAITRFLESEVINTIPNSLLLAFEPGVAEFISVEDQLRGCLSIDELANGCDRQVEWGFITFSFDPDQPQHLRPALIVDGQHRAYGMSQFSKEDLPVIVVSLVGASRQEQAFQFIVVNNKQVKVPTDNVKAIIAELDEEELQARLLKAGVKYGDMSPVLRDVDDLASSPFQHLLDWAHNRTGTKLVPLTAIEQSLRYLRTVFSFFEDDEDSQVQVFLAIWRAVRAVYPDLWGQEESKLMKKVSINALNEFIVDRLKVAWEYDLVNIFSPEDVERQTLKTLQVPQGFWQNEWTVRIQDNANVRNLIKSDLETVTDNLRLRRHWNEGTQLLVVSD